MKKTILLIITLFLFINVKGLEINSKNAILYNMNEKSIIYEKNSEEKVQVASLTKIITAITVIDNTEDLNKEVIITKEMLQGLDGYAKAGFRVGDKLTYLDLLYALMLPSAADAAQALAIDISGSIEEFSNLMNKKINEIGALNSKFDNPIGIDSENNYSTASDMAKILIYSLKNKTFETIFNSNTYKIESLNKIIKKTLASYNTDTSIIKGAKTGYEIEAGVCLASTSSIEGVDYLLITLGAEKNNMGHIKDTLNIYEYYSTNYGYIKILEKNQIIDTIGVKHSKTKTFDIKVEEDVLMYLQKNIKGNLTYKFEGVEYLNKDIQVKDKIGVIKVYNNEEVIYNYDVYLNKDIKYYNYTLYISFTLLVFILIFIIIKQRRKNKLHFNC